jgi:phage RecT family recombinase
MVGTSLGKPQDVDAWVNAALASIGADKEVLDATAESILGALLEAATLGLRFEGPLGEAYLATRKKKDGRDERGKNKYSVEAQLQVGYRGLMKLARRDPRVRKVEAIIVYENDTFSHQLGTSSHLDHTWDVRKPRGRMVAVYAAVRYHDGFYDFGQPYSIDAVMRHREDILADKWIQIRTDEQGREKFFKVFDDGEKELSAYDARHIPWINYIEAMIQKTAVRWSAKFWDLTPDFDRAAALISIDEAGRSQHLEDLVRRIVPSAVLDRPDDTGAVTAPGQKAVSGTQGVSLTRMGSLREQMLRESGVRPAAVQNGPPPEAAAEGTAEPSEGKAEAPVDGAGDPLPEQPPAAEMTEEEKAEAIRLEKEEAESFAAEQQRLADEAEQARTTGRGGRRGTNNRG